ncbi:MAG: hypothetical protein ABIQ39_17065 [Ilumatobacteraceae bacterium]
MARRRVGGLFSPLSIVRHNALYKGALGGQRGWLIIGALVWAPRLVKRVLGRNEVIVATEKLVAGQVLRLEVLPQQTRSQRRTFRRT